MNTSRHETCQTYSGGWPRRVVRAVAFAACAGVCWLAASATLRAQTPAPTPSPPPWQQELDTLRLLEGSLQLAPAGEPSEAAARDQRLTWLYRELADKYPDRAAILIAAGGYAQRHEHPAEAIAFFQRAQTLEPADADVADLLGSVALRLGRTREACAQFQRAVSARPDDAHLHYTLANALYLFRHDVIEPPTLPDAGAVLNKSLEEFRRAAELAPGSLQYAQSYAETFYMVTEPDWEQAHTAWKAVLALSGTKRDFATIHLARVSLRMKRPAEAREYLAQINDPQFAPLKAKLLEQAAKMARNSQPGPP